MIENIHKNIKEFRKQKGFSNEYMAMELKISPSAYRKVEFNQTKLTVEKLIKIAQILEIEIAQILNFKSKIELYQANNENEIKYLQQIENFHHENKEINSILIDSLKSEILFLRQQLLKA